MELLSDRRRVVDEGFDLVDGGGTSPVGAVDHHGRSLGRDSVAAVLGEVVDHGRREEGSGGVGILR